MTSNFRYTYGDGGILTEEQRRFYEKNGFILIRNNIPHDDLDEYRQRFIDLSNGKVDPDMIRLVKDHSLKSKGVKGEYLLHKIEDFNFDDVLSKYTTHKAILDVVTSIIGPNVTALHSMLINKPPDADPRFSLHPMHQDLYYFPFRPAERIVASWTAMEKIDENNGCLFVVPGTHKGELHQHTYPKGYKNELYFGIHNMDHLPKYNLIMEKGDTVFFHPLILHGSGPNRSKGFRKAISCHYLDTNCDVIDVRGTIQQKVVTGIEKEIEKLGIEAKFEDYFKYKGRLVAGPPGKFQQFASHL